jgi:hypothetical protein
MSAWSTCLSSWVNLPDVLVFKLGLMNIFPRKVVTCLHSLYYPFPSIWAFNCITQSRKKRIRDKTQVPHKILSFCKILYLKITCLDKNFDYFLYNTCYYNSGLAFKSKNYHITSQNCVFFIIKRFQTLRQKCKRAFCRTQQWKQPFVFPAYR